MREQVVQPQKQIINALVRCEETVSELYAHYSRAVPDMEKFWTDLSKKEAVHAKLLSSLHIQLENGFIFYDLRLFNDKSVEMFLNLVHDAIHKVETGKVTAKEAMLTALSIEGAIVESQFYDIVHSDSKEYKIIAEKLAADTRDHVMVVHDKLQETLKKS